MISKQLLLLILLIALPLAFPKKYHFADATTGTSSSTSTASSTGSTGSTDSSNSTTTDSTTTDSTTTDSTDTTWMYGTCVLSTIFLLMVLIYVCYNCVKFCKGSSSRHTMGAKGGFPQQNPTYPNEQEQYPPPPYGQQPGGGYDYREQRVPY